MKVPTRDHKEGKGTRTGGGEDTVEKALEVRSWENFKSGKKVTYLTIGPELLQQKVVYCNMLNHEWYMTLCELCFLSIRVVSKNCHAKLFIFME